MRKGYKKTSIGTIPEDWEVKKIGDLFEFKNGLNKGKEYFGEGTKIVNYMDVLNNKGLEYDDIKGLVTVTKSEKERFNVLKGDVFFTRTSETVEEIGFSSVLLDDIEELVFSGFILRARPIVDELALLYKKYCFSSFSVRKQIIRTSSCTTRALTSGTLLKDVRILVPPLKEQEKIASILSSVDDHIEEVDSIIEDLKLLKKGLMQKLLTGQYTIEDGKLIKTKEFKKTSLGMIPMNWQIKNLNDIAKIVMGQSPKSEYYNEIKDGLPLIQGNADCKNRKTSPRIYTSEITKKCNIDDIIMTVRAPVGSISKSYHKACIGRGVCAIAGKEIDQEYLFQYLINSEKLWDSLSQGSTFTAVNSQDIRSFNVLVPNKKEQEKISSILSSLDNRIETYQSETQDLKQLKKGLMQELLTGKTRVKVDGVG